MSVSIVRKPAGWRASAPSLGLVWAAWAAAVASGFLLGALVGGWSGPNVPRATAGSVIATVVAIGLVRELRPCGHVLLRLALVACTWLGAVLIGVGARAGEDLRYSAQLRAWFATFEARAGVGLAIVGLALAVFLSFRRSAGTAETGDRR